MTLILRPAESRDLARITALMNVAFRGSGENASWNTEDGYIGGDRTSETALQEDLDATPSAFLLVVKAEEDAPINGCVWLEPLESGTWYLGSLTVNPAVQNGGFGRRLLEAAEQWAIARGALTMQMTVVNVRDTLIAWYERRGYHLTGEMRPFPYGDDRFGTPLRDDLAFVVLEKTLLSATS